jgi:hypothetical protein
MNTQSQSKTKAEVIINRSRPRCEATLNCRIKRQPPSLGNYFYHIEAGTKVYVRDALRQFATVSTKPPQDCVSEDYFRVPLSALNITPDYSEDLKKIRDAVSEEIEANRAASNLNTQATNARRI